MGLASACQSSNPRPPGITTGGPEGGSAGVAGATGTGGSAAGGTGATGGRDGTGASGGDAGATGIGDVDVVCSGGTVFWASGVSFQDPTPANLASELNTLALPATAHPITVVLAANGLEGEIATSATELATDGLRQAFPLTQVPDFKSATLVPGAFETDEPQSAGWMRFQDEQGDVDIALTNVSVEGTTLGGCSSVSGILSADIPASQAGVVLDLSGGATTVGALAGGAGPWAIRAVFGGGTIDFDFEALPDE